MWGVAEPLPPAKPSEVSGPNGRACGFPPEGLDAVLAVRTAVLNDTYDVFCEQHALLVA
jgi:hypothetical protein